MAYNDYFHVTTEEEEGQTRRLGELIGGRTARVNEDEKAKVLAEQVEVVGGCRQIYEVVDENLRQSSIRGCLWKETLDLHQWRWDYFKANFPSPRLWLSNTGRLNSISYQITKRFDQLVDVCCSPQPPPCGGGWERRTYLGVSSEELDDKAAMAKRLRIVNLDLLFHSARYFGTYWEALFAGQHSLSEFGLSYGDVAKTLFELHGNTPARLEELAMKTVQQEDRREENLSRPTQSNDQEGFFAPETYQHDLKNLTTLGQHHLQRLKALHDGKAEGRFHYYGCPPHTLFTFRVI